ncbi:uncharacterized protein LOC124789428 [Schistocerca piceifrons]|uniref:uncharacterized protein LOC124789428 n=1 Tax=Schistocerca piceifrons TaxID=274613 RepID=UPI001F5ECADA|nr:uncharacterized protein LOC124789428 [Schistocerca piceifrons]
MTEAIKKLMEEEFNKTTNHMIRKHKFKNIEHFKFLSAVIGEENQTSRRENETVNDNRVYYSTYKLLGSNLLIRNTKMKLYNTVIRPVLTYGAETWRRTPAMSFFRKKCIYSEIL